MPFVRKELLAFFFFSVVFKSHPECALGASRGKNGSQGLCSQRPPRRLASAPRLSPGDLEEPPATNTAEVSLWSAKASPGALGVWDGK